VTKKKDLRHEGGEYLTMRESIDTLVLTANADKVAHWRVIASYE